MASNRWTLAKRRDHDLALGPWANLFIAISVLGVLGYYYYDALLNNDPSGIHFIRQTDSIAFVRYYELGRGHLLAPGILNLNLAPDEGRAAAEFPILYWLASKLGTEQDPCGALRFINLVLVAAGQITFLFAARALLKGTLLTISLGAWMLGSSVLAYYALNYLPDSAAYGLVLMGWAFTLPKAWDRPLRSSMIGAVCFTLAALIKAPAGMHLAVAASAILMTWRGTGRFRGLALHSMGLVLAAAWHLWVNAYNSEARTSYFLTHAMPIWSMSPDEIAATWDLVHRYWWSKYLHPSTWHGLAILLMALTLRFRSAPLALRGVALGTMLGALTFIILFFPKLADHDYYFITILPAIGIIMLVGLGLIWHAIHIKLLRSFITIGVFSLAAASVILARIELQRRHAAPTDLYSATGEAMRQYMNCPDMPELPKDARVIVLGDATPHGALSALGRLGWSYPGYPEHISPNWQSLKAKGATHILRLHGWPMGELSCEELATGSSFALYRIIQP